MRLDQRGSALLTSAVVIVIITVIGIGIIRFSGRELAGASASASEQSLVSCAEAARQMLVSKFHALGLRPTELAALNAPLGNTNLDTARARAVGGHYDTVGLTVAQVSYLPEGAFGPTNRVRDESNIISLMGQGGRPMKVVVHCQVGGTPVDPTTGRQLEVEFGVRFGL